MTTDEFQQVLEARVSEFFVHYKAQSKRMPNEYPSEMPEGEWWEQFIASEL